MEVYAEVHLSTCSIVDSVPGEILVSPLTIDLSTSPCTYTARFRAHMNTVFKSVSHLFSSYLEIIRM